MTVNRKKTLANGKNRPAVRRYKANRKKRQRQEWLANFAPGARERFFDNVVLDRALFLNKFVRESGLERAEAAAMLERVATRIRWRKLRTLDGTVVGIAPPRTAA